MGDEKRRRMERSLYVENSLENRARLMVGRIRSVPDPQGNPCLDVNGNPCGMDSKSVDPACSFCNGSGYVIWPWYGERGRLALAHYCGDPVARAVLGQSRPQRMERSRKEWKRPERFHDLISWYGGLNVLWPAATLRAAIAAADVVYSGMEPNIRDDPEDPERVRVSRLWAECGNAMNALHAYLDCPNGVTRQVCVGQLPNVSSNHTAWLYYLLCAVQDCSYHSPRPLTYAVPALNAAIAETNEVLIGEVMRQALIAWAIPETVRT